MYVSKKRTTVLNKLPKYKLIKLLIEKETQNKWGWESSALDTIKQFELDILLKVSSFMVRCYYESVAYDHSNSLRHDIQSISFAYIDNEIHFFKKYYHMRNDIEQISTDIHNKAYGLVTALLTGQ